MTIPEVVSFVAFLAYFFYLMIRAAFDKREERLHPEKIQDKRKAEQIELKQILRSLDLDDEDEDFPEELKPDPVYLPPKPKYQAPVSAYRKGWADTEAKKSNWKSPPVYKNTVQTGTTSSYEVEGKHTNTRSKTLIKEIPKLRNMLVYYEIFGPPKAFRDD